MARTRLRKLWIWSFDEAAFYSAKLVGTSLHVCSGRSTVGDVRIDLYEEATIKADYRHLPIRDKAFDSVICDPVWGKSEPIHLGIKNWLFELVRVARKRIIIIHNTLFSLRWKGHESWDLVEAWAVRSHQGTRYKIMGIHEPQHSLIQGS